MERSSNVGRAAVAAYLAGAVAANVIIAWGGPRWLAVTAFFFVPFELVARDLLHELWAGPELARRMGALVLGGSVLTCLVSVGSWRVAAASFAAFAAAGLVDTVIYQRAAGRPRSERINLSNAAAAVTDSVVFPLVAFGSTSLFTSSTQAGAKFVGGFLWGLVYLEARKRWPKILG
jgi:uncharacterized PurR-regulated membrane protein YhhQ (DUF165 family)